ncbi:hypothetical protein [Devosia sp. FJ2-5-3]|uniref:hypothetical protein n=1 Tax=Devosia sp. FJ2-5-3 TaxID=2976680 RepID=UPI0023D80126|nr:hypothetical protein [Devosia sp. FJ2-5-3]WEJ58354.1 hypothetical protein N0P34_19630 [Devosia sp. FJ2-5-3]
MLGLSLGIGGLSTAQWWPASAGFAADFIARRFRRAGNAIPSADACDFARSSKKWARSADGNWREFDADIMATTDLGLSLEPAGTNLASPGPAGASVGIVGSGGALPTGWVANGALTTQIISVTTLLGLPAVRLRISGTAASTFYEIGFTPSMMGLDASKACSASIFAQCHSEIVPLVELRQGNSSDGFVAVNSLSPALSATARRSELNLTTQSTTARGKLRLALNLTIGNVYLVELTIACPQLETGAAPSSPLLAARSADALDLKLPESAFDIVVHHDSAPISALTATQTPYRVPTSLARPIRTILAQAS